MTRNLLTELHRRRVFRTLAYYVVSAWLLLQAADVLFPAWDIPESGIRYVFYAVVLGLPAALVFAWFFDVGPQGIQRTAPAEDGLPATLRGRDYVLLAALVAVLGAIAYGTLSDLQPGADSPPPPTPLPEDGTPVLAVLPFAAEGSSEDSVFFAEGVQEDLISQLSRVSALRVISSSSVSSYRESEKAPRTIGQELGASVMLEGVVRVLRDQLRISTELVEAETGAVLWADRFERPLTTSNLFGVQNEISRSIAMALRAELTPTDQEQLALIPTDSMAAYRAYRTATSKFDGGMSRPEYVEALEQAIELDPDFVPALAELTGVYSLRARRASAQQQAMMQRAESLIDRLNALAPGSVDHLYAQAFYVNYVLSDYDRALALLDRALDSSPNNLRLLQLKNWIQRRVGDLDGRAATLRRMMVLDPLEPSFRYSLLGTLFTQHRYDEVWSMMSPEDARNPALAWPYAALSVRNLESIDARIQGLSEAMARHPAPDPWSEFMVPFLQRDFEAALLVARSAETPAHWPDAPFNIAAQLEMLVHWASGDRDALQPLIDAGRARAAEILAADPQRADDYYFRKQMVNLDALEGRVDAVIDGQRRLERESLGDRTLRMADLAEYCGHYAMVALVQETVDCIRVAVREPSRFVSFLEPWFPIFDPVRDAPEFQALLAEF